MVTAAGGVDHDALCDQLSDALSAGGWPLDAGRGARAAPDHQRRRGCRSAGAEVVVRRATEQANVIVGGVGLTATDERRYAMSVLGAVLGGGMSSRLFQEIRERRGLAYSVYSFSSGHADTGLFGVYAGCAPDRVDEVQRLCWSSRPRRWRPSRSPEPSWTAASASCPAGWCSAWRTPARG